MLLTGLCAAHQVAVTNALRLLPHPALLLLPHPVLLHRGRPVQNLQDRTRRQQRDHKAGRPIARRRLTSEPSSPSAAKLLLPSPATRPAKASPAASAVVAVALETSASASAGSAKSSSSPAGTALLEPSRALLEPAGPAVVSLRTAVETAALLEAVGRRVPIGAC